MAHNFVSTPFSARYVRLSTRFAEKGVLSRSASKYRAQVNKLCVRRIAVSKAPFSAGYVRLSTRPLKRVPFPCSSSEYRRQTFRRCFAFCIQMTPSGNAHLFEACLSTTALFRRRSNEQLERDALRPDAHLFEVEPLTNAHSFGACLNTMFLFQGRSHAPLSQTCTVGEFLPTLASRGALSECRAPTKH